MKMLWWRFVIWWRREEPQCSCDPGERGPLVMYEASGWRQWCGKCLGLLV